MLSHETESPLWQAFMPGRCLRMTAMEKRRGSAPLAIDAMAYAVLVNALENG